VVIPGAGELTETVDAKADAEISRLSAVARIKNARAVNLQFKCLLLAWCKAKIQAALRVNTRRNPCAWNTKET
jgi:hypothetical protein